MKTKVQKWGNSLALRIPKPFAVELGLSNESAVEISVQNRKLLVEPTTKPQLTLSQLLTGVTKDNRHAEITVGPAAGNEAW